MSAQPQPPHLSAANAVLTPGAATLESSVPEDAHVSGLGLQRPTVEDQQAEEEKPARKKQTDHDQDRDERLRRRHQHKQ